MGLGWLPLMIVAYVAFAVGLRLWPLLLFLVAAGILGVVWLALGG